MQIMFSPLVSPYCNKLHGQSGKSLLDLTAEACTQGVNTKAQRVFDKKKKKKKAHMQPCTYTHVIWTLLNVQPPAQLHVAGTTE